ncbi:hypothetical protein [Asticcacaulis sp. AC402]|uniref:hypothetical protein n=1 Tax=Asticcacaulis sp. AC402 TaxID=1282361 RepID=UPI0003C3ACA9|nr:hypothetical protein [Asticcacaulis sp. AC402]ESQ73877.1 hypothetical protein ABAC402_17160 [Asticcacaulis sp. AC402]
MKEDQGCLRHVKLLLGFVVLAFSIPFNLPAKAETAPDSFRESVIDVTAHCYPVFSRLEETYWPDRDPAEVAELKQDAAAKREYSMDMLRRYSAIYYNFSINEQIEKAEGELSLSSADNDALLDIAIMCEKELFKLIDEESEKGYTP